MIMIILKKKIIIIFMMEAEMIIISMSILPQTNWESASVRETIDYYILFLFYYNMIYQINF